MKENENLKTISNSMQNQFASFSTHTKKTNTSNQTLQSLHCFEEFIQFCYVLQKKQIQQKIEMKGSEQLFKHLRSILSDRQIFLPPNPTVNKLCNNSNNNNEIFEEEKNGIYFPKPYKFLKCSPKQLRQNFLQSNLQWGLKGGVSTSQLSKLAELQSTRQKQEDVSEKLMKGQQMIEENRRKWEMAVAKEKKLTQERALQKKKSVEQKNMQKNEYLSQDNDVKIPDPLPKEAYNSHLLQNIEYNNEIAECLKENILPNTQNKISKKVEDEECIKYSNFPIENKIESIENINQNISKSITSYLKEDKTAFEINNLEFPNSENHKEAYEPMIEAEDFYNQNLNDESFENDYNLISQTNHKNLSNYFSKNLNYNIQAPQKDPTPIMNSIMNESIHKSRLSSRIENNEITGSYAPDSKNQTYHNLEEDRKFIEEGLNNNNMLKVESNCDQLYENSDNEEEILPENNCSCSSSDKKMESEDEQLNDNFAHNSCQENDPSLFLQVNSFQMYDNYEESYKNVAKNDFELKNNLAQNIPFDSYCCDSIGGELMKIEKSLIDSLAPKNSNAVQSSHLISSFEKPCDPLKSTSIQQNKAEQNKKDQKIGHTSSSNANISNTLCEVISKISETKEEKEKLINEEKLKKKLKAYEIINASKQKNLTVSKKKIEINKPYRYESELQDQKNDEVKNDQFQNESSYYNVVDSLQAPVIHQSNASEFKNTASFGRVPKENSSNTKNVESSFIKNVISDSKIYLPNESNNIVYTNAEYDNKSYFIDGIQNLKLTSQITQSPAPKIEFNEFLLNSYMENPMNFENDYNEIETKVSNSNKIPGLSTSKNESKIGSEQIHTNSVSRSRGKWSRSNTQKASFDETTNTEIKSIKQEEPKVEKFAVVEIPNEINKAAYEKKMKALQQMNEKRQKDAKKDNIIVEQPFIPDYCEQSSQENKLKQSPFIKNVTPATVNFKISSSPKIISRIESKKEIQPNVSEENTTKLIRPISHIQVRSSNQKQISRPHSNIGLNRKNSIEKVQPSKQLGKNGFQGKSNIPMIKSAIKNVCLAGAASKKEQDSVLNLIDGCQANHLIVLFKGRHDLRGLYAFDTNAGINLEKIYGTGCPQIIESSMVSEYYRYDVAAKEFKQIIGNKTISKVVDAINLQTYYLKKN